MADSDKINVNDLPFFGGTLQKKLKEKEGNYD